MDLTEAEFAEIERDMANNIEVQHVDINGREIICDAADIVFEQE